jgi:hypothetical protein
MQDIAEKLAAAQSHSSHRVVAFDPLAPAALFVRIALTFAAIRVRRNGRQNAWITPDPLRQSAGWLNCHSMVSCTCMQSERWADTSWLRLGGLLVLAAAGWAALFAAKLALGFALKRAAAAYVQHYDAHAKPRSVTSLLLS